MGSSGKARPSLAWFILPCVLLLGAVLLVGLGVSSVVQFLRADFRPYQPGSSISVTTDGFTLYVRDQGVCPRRACRDARDDTSRGVDLRCTATSPDRQVPLSASATGSSTSNEHGSFVAIATSPRDMPAGRYVLSCVGASARSDVPLFLGPRIDLGAVMRGIALSVIAPIFLGICAVVLLAILAFLRYRSGRVATPTGHGPAPTPTV